MATPTIIVSCHCGQARQTLFLQGSGDLFSDVSFCHCDTCRHVTGQLYTSYVPLSPIRHPDISMLQARSTSPSETRYFCPKCGCHVFRLKDSVAQEWEVATGVILDAPELDTSTGPPRECRHKHLEDIMNSNLWIWMRADTARPLPNPPAHPHPPGPDDARLLASCHCERVSLSISRPSLPLSENPDAPFPDLLLPYHSTPPSVIANPSKSKWYIHEVPSSPSHPSKTTEPGPSKTAEPAPSMTTEPDPGMIVESDPSMTTEPGPSKTAEQGPGKTAKPDPSMTTVPEPKYKYLAGTCACASCRLTSGFEVQSWAFVPVRNIQLMMPYPDVSLNLKARNDPPLSPQLPSDLSYDLDVEPKADPPPTTPHHPPALRLDFASSPTQSLLSSYSSSPGVTREFCGGCGATCFWRSTERPELVDLSAGLIGAPCRATARAAARAGAGAGGGTRTETGARADDWLHWHTGRTSFAEEAGTGRHRGARAFGELVVDRLEAGLRKSRERENDGVYGQEIQIVYLGFAL
ncbi:hypothetical protein MFIFM68171_02601 [Madurella fahalii]|uniref:CENP-V/GFA domain-containing protein n=1 Tax=Madurella fahalii TaxID=1157608 RepID=A0ABQ0G3R2_9PEZI